MKINENTKICGSQVVLVPYESSHVPKYHSWMEDEELRRLTGSERLTLEEEYEMQRNWRNDEDKLTFIVLLKKLVDDGAVEEDCMVGDVNLFVNFDDATAEVEVMVAEPSARGQGVGLEAVRLIISYAIKELKPLRFFVKITDDNVQSLNLFEKKLGFERVSHSKAFAEYTLELSESQTDIFAKYIAGATLSTYGDLRS